MTSNSAIVTSRNEATKSGHSLVECPTFGNSKEEDELLQLWRKAYAVIDEAIGVNQKPINTNKQHFFKVGRETIRVPNVMPTSKKLETASKRKIQLSDSRKSKISSGVETLGCEAGTFKGSSIISQERI